MSSPNLSGPSLQPPSLEDFKAMATSVGNTIRQVRESIGNFLGTTMTWIHSSAQQFKFSDYVPSFEFKLPSFFSHQPTTQAGTGSASDDDKVTVGTLSNSSSFSKLPVDENNEGSAEASGNESPRLSEANVSRLRNNTTSSTSSGSLETVSLDSNDSNLSSKEKVQTIYELVIEELKESARSVTETKTNYRSLGIIKQTLMRAENANKKGGLSDLETATGELRQATLLMVGQKMISVIKKLAYDKQLDAAEQILWAL